VNRTRNWWLLVHSGLGSPIRYPSSWKGLAQAKNGDEQFWKEKLHAANGKAQHALMNCTNFFLFEWVGGEGFFVFFSCSKTVPKYIPHNVPNGNTSSLSHMVCSKFNSHVYKLQRWNPGRRGGQHICLYLATGVQKRCFYWGMPNVQKKFADGPINMAPLREKTKKVVSVPMNYIINKDLNRYGCCLHRTSKLATSWEGPS
jgi:hypothetical protein